MKKEEIIEELETIKGFFYSENSRIALNQAISIISSKFESEARIANKAFHRGSLNACVDLGSSLVVHCFEEFGELPEDHTMPVTTFLDALQQYAEEMRDREDLGNGSFNDFVYVTFTENQNHTVNDKEFGFGRAAKIPCENYEHGRSLAYTFFGRDFSDCYPSDDDLKVAYKCQQIVSID